MAHDASSCIVYIIAKWFLDASSHLYKRPCPSVGPSVMLSSKSVKNGFFRFLNDLDSA